MLKNIKISPLYCYPNLASLVEETFNKETKSCFNTRSLLLMCTWEGSVEKRNISLPLFSPVDQ